MSEPVRILNLFTIMNRGGAETMVMNYYRNVDRSKVQFDFLVHREEKGVYEDEIEKLGGRVYRMLPICPQNFQKYKRQLRVFFKHHPEYRMIHSHMSELGYFAFKEAKKQGVPVIICHAHNAPHVWNLKMVFRTYFKYMMRSYVTHMFMCGEEAGTWLYGKKNKQRFIQMNNAIEADKFTYQEDEALKVREELGLQDEFVVGHVGRFSLQKNHGRLIDIFSEIVKIKPNSRLLLIGTGELERKIREKVECLHLNEKVTFLGSRPDVNRIMQAFDIYCFPSFHEGLSVAMVEAQASGTQCFISDSIPKQCMITDIVSTFCLSDSNEKIAKFILSKNIGFVKKNMLNDIIRAGFDIKSNAVWLQEFYIKVYQEHLVNEK